MKAREEEGEDSDKIAHLHDQLSEEFNKKIEQFKDMVYIKFRAIMDKHEEDAENLNNKIKESVT